MRRRARVAVLAAAAALLALPGGAQGHLRSGTVAVDYRATVHDPVTPAYSARIFQSDRALELTIKSGHTVVLLGYLGERVFRLDRAGLWVNSASPTAVVARLATRAERGRTWRLERGRHSVVWHDSRAQGLRAGVSAGTWTVPLVVDGRRAALEGQLRRLPAPLLWPWLAALAVLLAVAASPLVLRRGVGAASMASALAVAAAVASILIAVAFVPDAYASPGTWIESLDALAFLAAGGWLLLRGPRHLRVAGSVGIGLVGLALGLLNGPVFLHPIVLAIMPATVVRGAALVAVGAGLGAAALGCAFYVENPAAIRAGLSPHGAQLPVTAERAQ